VFSGCGILSNTLQILVFKSFVGFIVMVFVCLQPSKDSRCSNGHVLNNMQYK
jgi:hypothetical protein